MRRNDLTLKVFLFCVMNDCLDSVAQVFMKKGIGHFPEAWYLGIGIALYALNFLLWIGILSRLDLSTAVPIASTNYIILPILAMFFLGEHIGLLRWIGIAFIILGIHFISKSAPSQISGESP